MNEPNATPTPPNSQTELAKERNRVAADRTLLSWIRSTASFIGISFGIDQILNTLGEGNRVKLGCSLWAWECQPFW